LLLVFDIGVVVTEKSKLLLDSGPHYPRFHLCFLPNRSLLKTGSWVQRAPSGSEVGGWGQVAANPVQRDAGHLRQQSAASTQIDRVSEGGGRE
jgi:hypothetical protein